MTARSYATPGRIIENTRFCAGHPDAWTRAANRKLRDLAAGSMGKLIAEAFRVMPRQTRSMDSVERMLAAAATIVIRARRLDGLTLDAIAEEAGVTPQAVYRYFRDVNDLIRLAVRRILIVEHERLMTFLSQQRFATEADLANAAVLFILEAHQELLRVPARIRDRVTRDYWCICYDALWRLSEVTCATMVRRGDPCASIDAVHLNAGLTATVSVATSCFLQDARLLSRPGVRSLMVDIFLAALRDRPVA